MKTLKEELFEEIDKHLTDYLDGEVKLILDIGNYILNSGGKRLRPVLVLAFAKMLGREDLNNLYPLAAALEYIHTASLLHDDVVDGADKRRGKKSANRVFGNDTVVLTGDYMYANSLYLFSIYGDIDMIKNVSDTVKKMAEGQLLELKRIGDIDLKENEYFKILKGKTAVLFASCCYVGASYGGATDELKTSAYNYGLKIGLAFQLIDDLLDYISNENKLGKPVCNDLREGKLTYPLLSILNKLDKNEIELIKSVIRDLNPSMEDIEKVKNLVEIKGGFDNTVERAKELIEEALNELEKFPKNKYFDDLQKLAKYIVERDF